MLVVMNSGLRITAGIHDIPVNAEEYIVSFLRYISRGVLLLASKIRNQYLNFFVLCRAQNRFFFFFRTAGRDTLVLAISLGVGSYTRTLK